MLKGDDIPRQSPTREAATLSSSMLWLGPERNKPDWKRLRDHYNSNGGIAKKDLMRILQLVSAILKKEGNVIYAEDPVTVVGDIHGQYYDLLQVFEYGGDPEFTSFLFLGDMVDRGQFSIEVITLLYAMKINYPETMLLLRGNHESREMSVYYTFRKECLHKYDQDVYNFFLDSFNCLPLACVIDGKYFATHGGLSPALKTIEDIVKLDRFHEPPRKGIMCDLLWSDPIDEMSGFIHDRSTPNHTRGCSIYFGVEMVSEFLERNNLISIIRAHEVENEGYRTHNWKGANQFPCVITVFSAANYCDFFNNKGAFLRIENNNFNIQQLCSAPQPNALLNTGDAFSLSMPFVCDKVKSAIESIVEVGNDQDEFSIELDRKANTKVKEFFIKRAKRNRWTRTRINIFRCKLRFVTLMFSALDDLRNDVRRNEIEKSYFVGNS